MTTVLPGNVCCTDLLALMSHCAGDRRFWWCSIFGAGFSVGARHVVDGFGNLVAMEAWR